MTLRELLELNGINLDQQLVDHRLTRAHKPAREPVPPGHPERLWEAPAITIDITLAPWTTT